MFFLVNSRFAILNQNNLRDTGVLTNIMKKTNYQLLFSYNCNRVPFLHSQKKKILQWFFRMVKGSNWNLLLSEPG